MTAEEFNALYCVGMSVNYHPIIGQPGHAKTKTRSDAWTLPGGQHVVQIEGKAGCVSLDAITIDPELEKFARLGVKVEDHHLDCGCADCEAFLRHGDALRGRAVFPLKRVIS